MAFKTGKSLVGNIDQLQFVGRDNYDNTTAPSNEVKIIAPNATAFDEFGSSVAVGHGIIAVGAWNLTSRFWTGSVDLFRLNGTPILTLTPPLSTFRRFGISVAIGGGRIVVGSYGDVLGANDGAIHIFDLKGTQIAVKTAADVANNDYFGSSVAVGSGRVVVGAEGDDDNGTASGSAYIFDLDGNELAKITASDGAASDWFGSSVAVGSGRIVVGARGDDHLGLTSGSAYIFDLDGNELAKITASSDSGSDEFGSSVAVGSGRIVVAAPRDNDNGFTNSGAVYVFDLNGNELFKLLSSQPNSNRIFGKSVAIGSGRIIVSEMMADTARGAVYIFDLDGNELDRIVASDGAIEDYFGESVAIGSGKIVVGSYRDDDGGLTNSGSAYIYETPKQTHMLDIFDGR